MLLFTRQHAAFRSLSRLRLSPSLVFCRIASVSRLLLRMVRSFATCFVQSRAKEWSLCCVNSPPVARGSQEAGFTQPTDQSLALCEFFCRKLFQFQVWDSEFPLAMKLALEFRTLKEGCADEEFRAGRLRSRPLLQETPHNNTLY